MHLNLITTDLHHIAIFILHSSQLASFSLSIVKYLQRRLLFLWFEGTTNATLEDEVEDVEEVSEEREVALKVLVEVVVHVHVCPEAIKKEQEVYTTQATISQLLTDLHAYSNA